MVTVVRTLKKTGFISLVLLLLGPTQHVHSSQILGALSRAWNPPPQTFVQRTVNEMIYKADPSRRPPTVGEAVFNTIVTPMNAMLALSGATYLLYQTGRAYYIREHSIYANIISLYKNQLKTVPTSFIDQFAFFYRFIDAIRQINGAQATSSLPIYFEAFMRRLTASMSFPSYTKVAASLSNDFNDFKTDLKNIQTYTQEHMNTLKWCADIYVKVRGNYDNFIMNVSAAYKEMQQQNAPLQLQTNLPDTLQPFQSQAQQPQPMAPYHQTPYTQRQQQEQPVVTTPDRGVSAKTPTESLTDLGNWGKGQLRSAATKLLFPPAPAPKADAVD